MGKTLLDHPMGIEWRSLSRVGAAIGVPPFKVLVFSQSWQWPEIFGASFDWLAAQVGLLRRVRQSVLQDNCLLATVLEDMA